jgi:hypothetical protein
MQAAACIMRLRDAGIMSSAVGGVVAMAWKDDMRVIFHAESVKL